jgi:high affinity sulfate transporter 1
MLGAAVAPLAGGDPVRYAALAGGLTLLAGAILLIAGVARLGLIADFLSEPVLLGYQAGLALVVIASQLPRLVGLQVEAESTLGRFYEVLRGLPDISIPTSLIGLATLAIVILVRRWRPAVPGALFALVVFAVAAYAFDLASHGVAVLGEIPSGFPQIAIPDVGWGDLRSLLPAAAAISLLAAADTLVSSRAFAVRGGYAVDANRDLVGLGTANLSSAVSGGITISASAARTAVAESVGSKSQVAGLTAAVLMVVVLLVLTGPLSYVPVAALAAIVIAAVLRLIEISALRTLYIVRRVEFVIALAAMAGVVAVGVLEGVVIAMGLSLLDFLWRTSRPHDAVLGWVPGRAGCHDVVRVKDAATVAGVLVYRFDAPLFYANAEQFRSRVRALVRRHHDTRVVVLDASAIADIDVTAGRMLGELRDELEARDVRLVVAHPVGELYDLLVGDELRVDFTADDMFDTVDEAVAAAGFGDVPNGRPLGPPPTGASSETA